MQTITDCENCPCFWVGGFMAVQYRPHYVTRAELGQCFLYPQAATGGIRKKVQIDKVDIVSAQ